ncbi:MAG: GTPase HflX [Chloroflexota bacterium]|nr:GTPase HflX [Chloroflexota bacterium]
MTTSTRQRDDETTALANVTAPSPEATIPAFWTERPVTVRDDTRYGGESGGKDDGDDQGDEDLYEDRFGNDHRDGDDDGELHVARAERPFPTARPTEQALLIAVDVQARDKVWETSDTLEELARLAETVDVEVVGSVTQRLAHPMAGTYFGKGKLGEVKALREGLGYDMVLVDSELTPAQQRNLEQALDVKVIDRTALILDVFARRAQTHEGRLQVELAQLQYRLPRLTRMWTHLSRQGVGGVGLRGPGETQLEADRREVNTRIAHLKKELQTVNTHRELHRERRRHHQTPVVALVGYTNAGKSTLLNALTGAGVMAEDKLFATLDPTTRRGSLPSGRDVLLTDTVGFINNLPTLLIAAFRATLEEINEATVLVHVLDVTHPNAFEQAETVQQVLEDLGADDAPMVVALNKVDAMDREDDERYQAIAATLATSARAVVPISAQDGRGIAELLARVEETLEETIGFVPVLLRVPFDRGDLVDRFHRVGRVQATRHDEAGTEVEGLLPETIVGQFSPYVSVRDAGRTAPPAAAPDDAPDAANTLPGQTGEAEPAVAHPAA